jgi:hypothetical protein
MARPKKYKIKIKVRGIFMVSNKYGNKKIHIKNCIWMENHGSSCTVTCIDGEKYHCVQSIRKLIKDHKGCGLLMIGQRVMVNLINVLHSFPFSTAMICMIENIDFIITPDYQRLFDEIKEEYDYNCWKDFIKYDSEMK